MFKGTIVGDLYEHYEAADLLGVAPATLYGWNCEGTGPKRYRVGKCVGYKAEDLRAFMEQKAASK